MANIESVVNTNLDYSSTLEVVRNVGATMGSLIEVNDHRFKIKENVILSSAFAWNATVELEIIENSNGLCDIKINSKVFGLGANTTKAKSKHGAVQAHILNELKKYNQSSISSSNTTSIPDEILKYKKLLDAGVITQKEFEQKKKELLSK